MFNNIIEELKKAIPEFDLGERTYYNLLRTISQGQLKVKKCPVCGSVYASSETMCYDCLKIHLRCINGSLLDTVNTSHEKLYEPKKLQSYYQKNNYCGEYLEISQSNYPRHRSYDSKGFKGSSKKDYDLKKDIEGNFQEIILMPEEKGVSQEVTIQSNLRRRRNIRRIINSNINNKSRANSKHLTLTFNYDEFDYDIASKLFDLFLKRLKYHFIKDGRYTVNRYKIINKYGEEEIKEVKVCSVKYFKVVELQPESKRIHFHVLLFYCDKFPVWDYIKYDGRYFQDWYSKDGKTQTQDKIIEFQKYYFETYGEEYQGNCHKLVCPGMASIWGLGNIRFNHCYKVENLGSYFSKYITKDIPIHKDLRIYSCSRDLERPIEIIYPHWDLLHLQNYDVEYEKSIYLDSLSYYQNFKKLDNRCITVIFCKLRC